MAPSSSLSARLVGPWAHPTGLAGRFAGWEMARGKAALNERVAELLAPAPDDRLLEVGFGPGTTIRHLAPLVPAGRVVGVDPSTVMFRQATRRNRAAIAAGRVELHVAAAERLPFDDACFDKALTLHSIAHWTARDQGLREVHRVLKPGGALLIALRGEHGTEAVEAALAGAGFRVRRCVSGASERHRSTLLVATAAP
jgi:ubiquinone/menaquinone biosynthesis C-methylase UbiE